MRCYLRAENQSLTVGSVQIDVLEVRSDSVRLGINDPGATPNYREEILYLGSDDDEDDAEPAFDSFEFEAAGAFAMPVR